MASDPSRHGSYVLRLTATVGASVLLLVVLAWLGPSPERVDDWLARTGRNGPVVLLDEISIVQTMDEVSQAEQRTLAGATQGVQVAPEESAMEPDEEALREITPQQGQPIDKPTPRPVPGLADRPDLVDRTRMDRPGQTSPDFVLLHFVRAVYPESASLQQRQRTIEVRVAIYVNEAGRVEHAYVVSSEGGAAFNAEVLKAVRQWIYQPLIIDGKANGFWDEQIARFGVGGQPEVDFEG